MCFTADNHTEGKKPLKQARSKDKDSERMSVSRRPSFFFKALIFKPTAISQAKQNKTNKQKKMLCQVAWDLRSCCLQG